MNQNNFLKDRSSIRIRAPPGGKSSIGFIFGDNSEDRPAPYKSQRRQQQDHRPEIDDIKATIQSETKAAPRDENLDVNKIVEKSTEIKKITEVSSAVHTGIRIRQTPGGTSTIGSIIFGEPETKEKKVMN